MITEKSTSLLRVKNTECIFIILSYEKPSQLNYLIINTMMMMSHDYDESQWCLKIEQKIIN